MNSTGFRNKHSSKKVLQVKYNMWKKLLLRMSVFGVCRKQKSESIWDHYYDKISTLKMYLKLCGFTQVKLSNNFHKKRWTYRRTFLWYFFSIYVFIYTCENCVPVCHYYHYLSMGTSYPHRSANTDAIFIHKLFKQKPHCFHHHSNH